MQPTHEYTYLASDCQNFLKELQPKIQDPPALFVFAFFIMRLRSAKTQKLPGRIYSILAPSLRQRGLSKTPLFINKTNKGLSFVGDYKDFYALMTAAYPAYDAVTVDFITERMNHLTGAFLDVGANMGIIAASVAKSLQGREEVFAFEPVHETAERACAMCALNQITHVTVLECAIGDCDETLSFYSRLNYSESSSANAIGLPKEDLVEIQVPGRTLDSLAAEGVIGKIGLLKLDVEGYEIKALHGARTVITRDQPEIIFECHRSITPHMGWTLADATALISEMGDYEFHVIGEDGALLPLPPSADSRPDINIYCRPRGQSWSGPA